MGRTRRLFSGSRYQLVCDDLQQKYDFLVPPRQKWDKNAYRSQHPQEHDQIGTTRRRRSIHVQRSSHLYQGHGDWSSRGLGRWASWVLYSSLAHKTRIVTAYNLGRRKSDFLGTVYQQHLRLIQRNGWDINHRTILVDITSRLLLGTDGLRIVRPAARKLTCSNKRSVERFNAYVEKKLDEHRLHHRLANISTALRSNASDATALRSMETLDMQTAQIFIAETVQKDYKLSSPV